MYAEWMQHISLEIKDHKRKKENMKIKRCDNFQGFRKFQNKAVKIYYFLWWAIQIKKK